MIGVICDVCGHTAPDSSAMRRHRGERWALVGLLDGAGDPKHACSELCTVELVMRLYPPPPGAIAVDFSGRGAGGSGGSSSVVAGGGGGGGR